jgi:hypothetical protein
MVGTVGRTDLLGDEHREELAVQLFRALLRRDPGAARRLGGLSHPRRRIVLLSPNERGADHYHRQGTGHTNPLLQVTDEHEFVERLVSGLGSFPTYFRLLRERNR